MSLQNIGFSRFLLRTYSIPLALASCYCAELFRPLDSCVENAEHLVCTEELQAFDTLRNGRGGTCLVMTVARHKFSLPVAITTQVDSYLCLQVNARSVNNGPFSVLNRMELGTHDTFFTTEIFNYVSVL